MQNPKKLREALYRVQKQLFEAVRLFAALNPRDQGPHKEMNADVKRELGDVHKMLEMFREGCPPSDEDIQDAANSARSLARAAVGMLTGSENDVW